MKDEKITLSEVHYKIKEATKEECVEDLFRVATAFPKSAISRKLYRAYSLYSEPAWERHFGTFEEFKRQAGLSITRHTRKTDLNIARHASVDAVRDFNEQKKQWGDKYLKPKGSRYQTALICSDVHDIECDPFWRFLFIETVGRVKPEVIIINGDLFDLPEFGSYTIDPREWDVIGRIKWAHQFLGDIREKAPDAEILLVEGNHELRLLRHLSEATPSMKVVLSDLHGFTIPKLLGLDKFEVNYIAPADLATFTVRDMKAELRRNWVIIRDCFIAHHFPEGRNLGMPGVNGHHHKHIVWPMYSAKIGQYEWHQMGSGHKREASYCNGELWSTGFMLAHMDTVEKRVQFEYIDTTSNHCVIGGKWYAR